MDKCLDVESQGRTDACDIFIVQLLQNRSLACVIEATEDVIPQARSEVLARLQEEYAHFLLLPPVFPYDREQPHVARWLFVGYRTPRLARGHGCGTGNARRHNARRCSSERRRMDRAGGSGTSLTRHISSFRLDRLLRDYTTHDQPRPVHTDPPCPTFVYDLTSSGTWLRRTRARRARSRRMMHTGIVSQAHPRSSHRAH